MSNTYTQIYIHIVFAVKGRQNLISKHRREELHKYITGIVKNRGQKMLAVFSMPDHTHIFVGMKPEISVSNLVKDIKSSSTKHINNNSWFKDKFFWQEGYGAFSYSKSHIDNVVKYILNQEEHHKQTSFKEEYIDFLKKYEVDYDEKYLFEWIE